MTFDGWPRYSLHSLVRTESIAGGLWDIASTRRVRPELARMCIGMRRIVRLRKGRAERETCACRVSHDGCGQEHASCSRLSSAFLKGRSPAFQGPCRPCMLPRLQWAAFFFWPSSAYLHCAHHRGIWPITVPTGQLAECSTRINRSPRWVSGTPLAGYRKPCRSVGRLTTDLRHLTWKFFACKQDQMFRNVAID